MPSTFTVSAAGSRPVKSALSITVNGSFRNMATRIEYCISIPAPAVAVSMIIPAHLSIVAILLKVFEYLTISTFSACLRLRSSQV